MKKFYFTFGVDGMPYQGGWVEISADTTNDAIAKFIDRFGENAHTKEGFLNCAFVYEQTDFESTKMFKKGNMGEFCHECIY